MLYILLYIKFGHICTHFTSDIKLKIHQILKEEMRRMEKILLIYIINVCSKTHSRNE